MEQTTQDPGLNLLMSGQKHGVTTPIKASADPPEQGAIEGPLKQNMALYYTPTYKQEVDELGNHVERMDWEGLSTPKLKETGTEPHINGTNAC